MDDQRLTTALTAAVNELDNEVLMHAVRRYTSSRWMLGDDHAGTQASYNYLRWVW